jgi:hypothetical protein
MEAILKIPIRIIKEQEMVIGPLAWDEANKVSGLNIDRSHDSVSFSGDGRDIINRLVAQYERLFGRASHEVCREAVRDIIVAMSPEEIPSSLK